MRVGMHSELQEWHHQPPSLGTTLSIRLPELQTVYYSRGASALPDSTLRVLTLELRWTKTHIPAYLIRQWTTLGRSLHFLCQFFSKLGTYTYRFVVLLNVCSASSQQVLVNGSYYCDC